MTRTLTTLTAVGALCVATFAATPARAVDPWTAVGLVAGGAILAGLFWAPYAQAHPYGYAQPYGYASGPYGYAGGQYGYAGGQYGYASQVGYASTGASCYPAQVFQGGAYRPVRVCY
jgi:hypothetical protein